MGCERAEIWSSSHQGESGSWFIAVSKLRPLCAGLCSATFEFTSQCRTTCRLLFVFWNPTYFAVVALLPQGRADLSTVLTHYLVKSKLICWNWNQESDLPSVPALRSQELGVVPATERCLSQTKPIIGIYWNGNFSPEVRDFHPILPLASRKKGGVLQLSHKVQFFSPSFTFPQADPVSCH